MHSCYFYTFCFNSIYPIVPLAQVQIFPVFDFHFSFTLHTHAMKEKYFNYLENVFSILPFLTTSITVTSDQTTFIFRRSNSPLKWSLCFFCPCPNTEHISHINMGDLWNYKSDDATPQLKIFQWLLVSLTMK